MPGDAALDILVEAKTFALSPGPPFTVLRGIHLRGASGEVVALLGHSGIGKSTLLRIALGLDTAFEGKVRRPAGPVGVVFQDPRLLPWLTAADNLRLVMSGGDVKPRIEELLDFVGIPGVAQHLLFELSLGMARRVAIARALAVNPQLLVMDEPFASLDPRLAATLAKRIADRIRLRGGIILFATHDLDHALAVADRICVLAGRPATLAADVEIPDRGDVGAIGRLHAELVGRFNFLDTSGIGSKA